LVKKVYNRAAKKKMGALTLPGLTEAPHRSSCSRNRNPLAKASITVELKEKKVQVLEEARGCPPALEGLIRKKGKEGGNLPLPKNW